MDPPPKRRRVHRHQLHYKQAIEPDVILSDGDARTLLMRSIAMALTAAGFEAAEPDAMETFRADVEEFILHMLSLITETMLASRRVTAIPQDFASVLAREGISLIDLLPCLRNPIAPPSLCQQSLRPPSPSNQHEESSLSPILGPELNGDSERTRFSFIPAPFPSFPSKHTYKSTLDVKTVERDLRRVRERATEEARLGEEALRRLMMSAGRGKGIRKRKRGAGSPREKMEDLWRQTMEAIAKEEGKEMPPSLECGPINYPRQYWMKLKTNRRRATQPSSEMEVLEEHNTVDGPIGDGITTNGLNGSLSLNPQISGDGVGDVTSFQTIEGGTIKDSQSSVDGAGEGRRFQTIEGDSNKDLPSISDAVGDVASTQTIEGGSTKDFQSSGDGVGAVSSFETVAGDSIMDLLSSGEGAGDITSPQTVVGGGSTRDFQSSDEGVGKIGSFQTIEGDSTRDLQSGAEEVGDIKSAQTVEGGGIIKSTQFSGGERNARHTPTRDEGGSTQTAQSSQANNDSGTVEASSTPNTSQTAEPSQTNKEGETAATITAEDVSPTQPLEVREEGQSDLKE